MNRFVSYNIYPTLLDKFQSYLDSEVAWENFYGSSLDPEITFDEYENKCLKELIDSINRVPFDSEAADRGTCFNEVVDMIILGLKESKKIDVFSDIERNVIFARLKERPEREFSYPIPLCKEFATYYKGAIPQYYVSAILPTIYGIVNLYGYIDELMPTSVHDIKTTQTYKVGKYSKNWQHHVYPYCLVESGNKIDYFEYNVALLQKNIQTYTERYNYNHEESKRKLTAQCEWFIEFLNANKEKITDLKIFNKHEI